MCHVVYKTTQYHTTEDTILHSHNHENLWDPKFQLFLVINTLSVAWIVLCWNVGWSVNEELERIWKAASWPKLTHYPIFALAVLRRTMKISSQHSQSLRWKLCLYFQNVRKECSPFSSDIQWLWGDVLIR